MQKNVACFKRCIQNVKERGAQPWLQDSIKDMINTTYLIRKYTVLVYMTSPVRLYYQFICYTISGGRHFPQQRNYDCLPWILCPSLFYGLSVV